MAPAKTKPVKSLEMTYWLASTTRLTKTNGRSSGSSSR